MKTFPCGIVGSVVECSPATRAARVRFPDDANNFVCFSVHHLLFILGKKQLKHDCGKRKADPRDGAKGRQKHLETGGIDPPTSHMLSERSTI